MSGERLAPAFEGMVLEAAAPTEITGEIRDQSPALRAFERVRDLGLDLISAYRQRRPSATRRRDEPPHHTCPACT